MTRILRLFPILGLLLLGVGCDDGKYMKDDIDFELDFTPWSLLTSPNELHMPYVAGSTFMIYVRDEDDEDEADTWQLRTADTDVIRLDGGATGRAKVTALRPGFARVEAVNRRGRVVYSAELEVRAPTRAEVYSHGSLLVRRDDDEARVDDVIVAEDGTATFLVRYFDGDTTLYGNGALEVDAPELVSASLQGTFLSEDRDWLQFTVGEAGDYEIELRVQGALVKTLGVHVVPASAVASVEFVNEAGGRTNEHWYVVYAEALSAEGDAIYGVEYSWTLDAVRQQGLGDLYRYQYERRNDRMLTASFEGLMTMGTIEASTGYVDTTNDIGGCSVGGGVPGFASALGLLGFAALLRRRKR